MSYNTCPINLRTSEATPGQGSSHRQRRMLWLNLNDCQTVYFEDLKTLWRKRYIRHPHSAQSHSPGGRMCLYWTRFRTISLIMWVFVDCQDWRKHSMGGLNVYAVPNHKQCYIQNSKRAFPTKSRLWTFWATWAILCAFMTQLRTAYTKVCKPTYRGQTKLRVDEPERAELPSGGQPGWSLDKDKFLSMFEHAQKNFPRLKWTVYIEDITFVFWKNTLSAEK